jgi:hypothetical protein
MKDENILNTIVAWILLGAVIFSVVYSKIKKGYYIYSDDIQKESKIMRILLFVIGLSVTLLYAIIMTRILIRDS